MARNYKFKNINKTVLNWYAQHSVKQKVTSKINIYADGIIDIISPPGVGEAAKQIAMHPRELMNLTGVSNSVAIITNGTAVLGLGDVGPKAAFPIMEFKSILYSEMADINSFPLCINEKNPEKLVDIIVKLADNFGAIHLEDIKSPDCFYVETELKKRLKIPVFHDDRHGTAVVIAAAFINAARLDRKKMSDLTVCLSGLGAAGLTTAYLLKKIGVNKIYGFDKFGVLTTKNLGQCNAIQSKAFQEKIINDPHDDYPDINTLHDLMQHTNVFLGLSAANILSTDHIRAMPQNSWVFALANPTPEINLNVAKACGAHIVAAGSSVFENQINNGAAYPGIIKAALTLGFSDITENIKIAAAYGLAYSIAEQDLKVDHIMPDILNKHNVPSVVQSIENYLAKKGDSKTNSQVFDE